jgi:hypothetical protein
MHNVSYRTPMKTPMIPVRTPDMPYGARTIRSIHAPVRLAELRFDPIDSAVETIHRIDKQLRRLEAIQAVIDNAQDEGLTATDASGKPLRFPSQAYNELLSLKQKAANDLLRYKYGRVVETPVEPDKPTPTFNVYTVE